MLGSAGNIRSNVDGSVMGGGVIRESVSTRVVNIPAATLPPPMAAPMPAPMPAEPMPMPMPRPVPVQ
ncbi:hypothetical protein D3C72_2544810 [compost metagenome]